MRDQQKKMLSVNKLKINDVVYGTMCSIDKHRRSYLMMLMLILHTGTAFD